MIADGTEILIQAFDVCQQKLEALEDVWQRAINGLASIRFGSSRTPMFPRCVCCTSGSWIEWTLPALFQIRLAESQGCVRTIPLRTLSRRKIVPEPLVSTWLRPGETLDDSQGELDRVVESCDVAFVPANDQ